MRLKRCVLPMWLGLALPVAAAEIAVLKSADQASWRPAVDAMRRAAAGHTLSEFDLRGDKAEAERVVLALKGRAAVFVALGPLAAQAAHESAPEVPLVVCMVQDPARVGIVAAPGLTGVAFSAPVKNQLAAFRLVNPRGVRIGVIYNPDNTGKLVQEAQRGAGVVRVVMVERPVASEKEVPQALRALLGGGSEAADALWFPPDPMLLGEDTRRFILAEALKAGKPVYAFAAALVAEGALVSNAPDLVSTGELAGELASRLGAERGAKIEFAIPRAELVINKKVADRLKLEIPPDALKAAAKVY